MGYTPPQSSLRFIRQVDMRFIIILIEKIDVIGISGVFLLMER